MAKKLKQLDNKFFARETYIREEFLKEAIKDKEEEFKRKYPNANVVERWNNQGCRLVVMEK